MLHLPQQAADSLDVVALHGQMNGMIFSRRNRSAAPAVLIEQKPRDLVMTPILGDLDQAVAVPFPICGACVKQDTYCLKMPSPHCEVDGGA